MLTFAAFCAISSAGYLLQRPARRASTTAAIPRSAGGRSPAASCRPAAAAIAAVLLAAAAVALALVAVDAEVAGLVALYGVITAAYSLVLKRLVIIDVMTIASLFILRVVAGAVAVEAQASEFLLVCTGDAGPLPRLHQAPPGGDAGGDAEGDESGRDPPAGARALLASRSSTR